MFFGNKYVKLARKISKKAHKGQVDKGGNPYFKHPEFVAKHVKGWKAKCVGYLHDVIEDTDVTAEYLLKKGMPKEIVDSVLTMTHDKTEDYFEYIERIKKNPIARKVKLADLMHNSDTRRLPKPLTRYNLEHLEKYEKAKKILKSK